MVPLLQAEDEIGVWTELAIIAFLLVLIFLYSRWSALSQRTTGLALEAARGIKSWRLDPIENQAHGEVEGKKVIMYEAKLFCAIIDYVKEGMKILEIFRQGWWATIYDDQQPAKLRRKLEKRLRADPAYLLWESMENTFFLDRMRSELPGTPLTLNRFDTWVLDLYHCANARGLNLDDIRAVHVCKHGEILFETPYAIFNGLSEAGRFRCRECTEARDIFQVAPTLRTLRKGDRWQLWNGPPNDLHADSEPPS